LFLEPLEDRMVPATFTAATASDLIADVNAANLTGGASTIKLAPQATFTLTAVDNSADGPTGLPVIAANDNLTILGNHATIERSADVSTPVFRLFDVAIGGTLTLQDLTLQNGISQGDDFNSSQGGAIINQGNLFLSGVTLQDNAAHYGSLPYGGALSNGPQGQGTANLDHCIFRGNSADAGGGAIANGGTMTADHILICNNSAPAGGAINSSGTLTLLHSTVSNNQGELGGAIIVFFATMTIDDCDLSGNSGSIGGALENLGGNVAIAHSRVRGNSADFGVGGGLNNDGGTMTIDRSIVSGNSATDGYGGGISNFGTLTINDSIVTGNSAGDGSGGGIANSSTLTVDRSKVCGNTALTGADLENDGDTTLIDSSVCVIAGSGTLETK
jgi:predicted outer membrane repeat protein